MANSGGSADNMDAVKTELKKRFNPDTATLEAVLDKIEEAQQMEELAGYSHWENPEKLSSDIESFSRGYGLQAGWNTWIGIQKVDTSHLTIDTEE